MHVGVTGYDVLILGVDVRQERLMLLAIVFR